MSTTLRLHPPAPSWSVMGLLVLLVSAGCAPAPPAGGAAPTPPAQARSGPKRLVAAIMGDAPFVFQKFNSGNHISGLDAMEWLFNGGLANVDDQGELRPQLAGSVPTVDNGGWKLLPDGRMETTWTIRSEASWQDGTPFTAEDLIFTLQVFRDAELPIFRTPSLDFLERLEVIDRATIRATWKRPYIDADRLFSRSPSPLPRQLLEQAYTEDKAGFENLPYWSREYVGTGPFKISEFVQGSHLVAKAFDDYVLGRPKIDVIEVKFIPDRNTLLANILAGEVEMTLGRSIDPEVAITVQGQWTGGRVEVAPSNLRRVWPQLINPDPMIITDVRFRQALLRAIDRQELVDTVAALGTVAYTVLPPGDPRYREIEAAAPRYDYDPRRARAIIQDVGHVMGPDGTFRAPDGQKLNVEIRAPGADEENHRLMFAIADFWKRVGVDVETIIVPTQRATDLEYQATRRGFLVKGGPSDVGALAALHSSGVPLPETRYVGGNDGRYSSPHFDTLYDRYLGTIPMTERVQLIGQMLQAAGEDLPVFPLFYRVEPTMIGNRLLNAGPRRLGSSQVWNAEAWDLR